MHPELILLNREKHRLPCKSKWCASSMGLICSSRGKKGRSKLRLVTNRHRKTLALCITGMGLGNTDRIPHLCAAIPGWLIMRRSRRVIMLALEMFSMLNPSDQAFRRPHWILLVLWKTTNRTSCPRQHGIRPTPEACQNILPLHHPFDWAMWILMSISRRVSLGIQILKIDSE